MNIYNLSTINSPDEFLQQWNYSTNTGLWKETGYWCILVLFFITFLKLACNGTSLITSCS